MALPLGIEDNGDAIHNKGFEGVERHGRIVWYWQAVDLLAGSEGVQRKRSGLSANNAASSLPQP